MKWFRGAVNQEVDLRFTNRSSAVRANEGMVRHRDVNHAPMAHMSYEDMKLALALLLKCIVTALILCVLTYSVLIRLLGNL